MLRNPDPLTQSPKLGPLDPANSRVASDLRDEFHRCLIQGDWRKLSEIIADDTQVVFTSLNINQRHEALQWLQKSFTQLHQAFPDMQMTVIKDCIKGNCIWSEISWSGTHLGKLGSIAPTKKKIHDRIFVEILELQDDGKKIASIKNFQDGNSLYMQLGVSGLSLPPLMSDSEDVDELRRTFSGYVLTPNSPNYPSQCILANADIPSAPAVILQCVGASDVVKAMAFCKEFRRKHPQAPRTAIRAGGHSFSGVSASVGGCVIDLRHMRSVCVNEEEETCWVDGGALAADLDREVYARGGFVVPNGQVSNTGVGGLASGGGYGLLTHHLGLMIDNILEYEFVLADGTITKCSKTKNPELFWAAKGGARWLGIVTRFKFKLTKLGTPTSNSIMMFDIKLWEKCFRASRKLTDKRAFAFPAIAAPPELNGRRIVLIHLHVLGDYAYSMKVLEQFLKDVGEQPFAEPLPLRERPWPEINSAVDFIWPYGMRVYAKGFELSNDEEKGVKFLEKFVEMMPLSAAVGLDWNTGEYTKKKDKVSMDDLGFFQRRESVYVGVLIMHLADGEDKTVAKHQCLEFLNATKELRNEHPQYVNFGEEHGLEQRTSKQVAERFRKIKQQVDPEGFFGSGEQ